MPENPLLLFAVASQDGQLVNQHFGHARGFYIYACDGSTPRLVEHRLIPGGMPYCGPEDPEQVGLPDKDEIMDNILSCLTDCAGVVAMRIGDLPQLDLLENGILVFENYNRIGDAVREAYDSLVQDDDDEV
ncbi:MAG: hypothetical protein LBU79_06675 [Planctomycetota bacterium]|jgi:nitrogen fixation protein NifB|nr:hypothetical protein [Planctomycetota bacterium]